MDRVTPSALLPFPQHPLLPPAPPRIRKALHRPSYPTPLPLFPAEHQPHPHNCLRGNLLNIFRPRRRRPSRISRDPPRPPRLSRARHRPRAARSRLTRAREDEGHQEVSARKRVSAAACGSGGGDGEGGGRMVSQEGVGDEEE